MWGERNEISLVEPQCTKILSSEAVVGVVLGLIVAASLAFAQDPNSFVFPPFRRIPRLLGRRMDSGLRSGGNGYSRYLSAKTLH